MSKCIVTIFLAILFFMSCAGPSTEEAQWIETTIKSMSIEDKAGELIDLWLDARELGKETYLAERIAEIKNYRIGSYMFLVYAGDMYEVAKGIERLKQAADYPLLIGAGSEVGAGGYVEQAVRFPTQMAVAAAGDSVLAYQAAKVFAQEDRAVGVQYHVTPNGSLNNNPDNPVINIRAFSDDPHLAATMAVAYIRGMQDQGFPAMISLFPGHGDTDIDSHLALPKLNVNSRERLFSVELVPFIAAIHAGCASIMTAHVIIPCLDTERPATLSKVILTDLLRNELDYKGLVYTDAIRMQAITNHYGIGESAILALEAGVDVIAWPSDYKQVIAAMVEAVRSGRITEERLHQSLRRRLHVKYMAGVHEYKPHPVEKLESKIGIPEHREVARKIAEKAITVAKDDLGLAPLTDVSQTAFIMFDGNSDCAQEIKAAFPGCPILNFVAKAEAKSVEIDPDPTRFIQEAKRSAIPPLQARREIMKKLQGKSIVIVPAFLGRGVRKERMQGYLETLEHLIQSGKKVCLISFGDPYIYRFTPWLQSYICAFSADEFVRQAAWKVLKGNIPAQGKMPVKIAGLP